MESLVISRKKMRKMAIDDRTSSRRNKRLQETKSTDGVVDNSRYNGGNFSGME